MPLTLCLHASGRTPRVYLLDGARVVGGRTTPGAGGDPSGGPGLAELAGERLEQAGFAPSDIARIALDIGPGRLSAVRAAASFCNAFAYGLDRPILPVVSSLAVGLQAERRFGLPALVVHKAAGANAYLGRVEDGRLTALRYGPRDETLAAAAVGLAAFALVGLAPDAGRSILPAADIVDGGDGEVSAETFAILTAAAPADAFVRAPVQPITEQSEPVNG